LNVDGDAADHSRPRTLLLGLDQLNVVGPQAALTAKPEDIDASTGGDRCQESREWRRRRVLPAQAYRLISSNCVRAYLGVNP
jgi:hypothetical protein